MLNGILKFVNYVVGPLGRHGAGHHGIPLINYGGPGRTTLQKYRPGTMPVSGTSKHLLLASLRLLELSEMQVSTSKCLLSLVCMQLDGTMLKAGLTWDENLGLVLGLQTPLSFTDMQDMNFMFPPEFLKRNLVTEVDVCMISALCSTVAHYWLPVSVK